ncbi:MAG: hypothetical protein JW938_00915 [Candidatus Omnitrophica bacterium]|nr:hypothetical protein [Candidatus Omnitrophota bacterium]
MPNTLKRVRRQKHIWQIAFVILAIAIFVQTFLLYKDNAAVRSKVEGLFSMNDQSMIKVKGFLEDSAVRNNPIEIQEIARPVNGAR